MVTEKYLNCKLQRISLVIIIKKNITFNVRMINKKIRIKSYHCIPHTVYLTDTKLLTDQDYCFIARILNIKNLVKKNVGIFCCSFLKNVF